MHVPPTPKTLQEVEAIAPGPVLDALVAQHALGYAVAWDDGVNGATGAYAYATAGGARRPVPRFSTDGLAAEAVVQALLAETDAFVLRGGSRGWYALSHYPDEEASHPAGNLEFVRLERAESRPHAVCRCALRTFVLRDSGPDEDEIEAAQEEWVNWAESQGS